MINAACTDDPTDPVFEGFACRATISITDLFSRDYYLRLSSIYRSAQAAISFEGPGDDFIGVQALVDVTGRAADVFRRVQASVNLEDSTVRLLPDAAITSGDEICKRVSVDVAPVFKCPEYSNP